jgi:hypothetical protein
MSKSLHAEAREMLRRWTNRTTGIQHMGFVCTYSSADDGSLTSESGKSIQELRDMAAPRYASAYAFRIMIMGRCEHNGQPAMRLEAWEQPTGDSIALVQPFRRGLFGNYPRPTGAPIDVGPPPPPQRSRGASRLP